MVASPPAHWARLILVSQPYTTCSKTHAALPTPVPCLYWSISTLAGVGAFNISRCIREMIRSNVAGVHIEDQVMQKRCGHRPNKAIVSQDEMVDRVKAAVDGRTDDSFVIMARTDALAVEGMQSAIDRAQACVEAGADMIFPEAMVELRTIPAVCRCGWGSGI